MRSPLPPGSSLLERLKHTTATKSRQSISPSPVEPATPAPTPEAIRAVNSLVERLDPPVKRRLLGAGIEIQVFPEVSCGVSFAIHVLILKSTLRNQRKTFPASQSTKPSQFAGPTPQLCKIYSSILELETPGDQDSPSSTGTSHATHVTRRRSNNVHFVGMESSTRAH